MVRFLDGHAASGLLIFFRAGQLAFAWPGAWIGRPFARRPRGWLVGGFDLTGDVSSQFEEPQAVRLHGPERQVIATIPRVLPREACRHLFRPQARSTLSVR